MDFSKSLTTVTESPVHHAEHSRFLTINNKPKNENRDLFLKNISHFHMPLYSKPADHTLDGFLNIDTIFPSTLLMGLCPSNEYWVKFSNKNHKVSQLQLKQLKNKTSKQILPF